ncbi:MAG: SAM-dependent methyltransferase [Acidobacteria bacterium]|nr:SAM-dependent methyltransferase [Acidobacteriota bacterium]
MIDFRSGASCRKIISMDTKIRPEEILKLAQGFMESRILHAAAELNLFTMLYKAPMRATEVADEIRGDARAAAALLDAVSAMGLLTKEGQTYRCESSMLSKGTPDSVLPMILHMSHLWGRWSHLADIVRGLPVKDEFDFSRDDEELRAFIGAMHSIGAPLAKQIVSSINPGKARALLDVGGGSGTYTIAFLRAVPAMRATLFDLPQVIEMAREQLNSEGLLERVTLVAGDYCRDELPAGHDLVLLSAIIHSNSLEENLELYRKSFRALVPGGRILIRDHVMEPDRTRPRDGAIFAINMLVGTSGGGCYTYQEIEESLVQAGFKDIRLIHRGEHMDPVIEAFK